MPVGISGALICEVPRLDRDAGECGMSRIDAVSRIATFARLPSSADVLARMART
jgi:hypothetical protein